MDATFVLLPGDGIGPEIVSQARRVLELIATRFGHHFVFHEAMIGGCAIDATGDPLPPQTIELCKQSTGVLLGAVGGPRWDDPNAKTRPEAGLLRIRKELGLFANLRPIKAYDELIDASPLKRDVVQGTDILFFRELTGGIYFGPSSLEDLPGGGQRATSTMVYETREIERIFRMAAEAARQRRGKLTMVDKANVLEASRLWRRVCAELIESDFPDLDYEVILVDAMAMHLISRPTAFDVVVTENLFGDILTDEASMLPGSLGMLPSASLGAGGPGLFEPIHGSAPDIAGKGIANPLATILAAAMMLRHSCGLNEEAEAIERAVQDVLATGARTADLARDSQKVLSTIEMTDLVLAALQ
ncbi:MAG: 3-isopropylmalate dehydrogenase [Planctomycetota bacterium]|nr:MAG: 3-isopropylmalate dehydrogenase [Planctomycetota bacterium]